MTSPNALPTSDVETICLTIILVVFIVMLPKILKAWFD